MKKDIVREKIIQTSTQVFETHGFEKTTLDDLGKAVGLNKTSLYYYYANKEELFAELIHRQGSEFLESLSKKTGKKKSFKAAVSIYITEKKNILEKFKILFRSRYQSEFVQQPIIKAINKIKKAEQQWVKNLLMEGIKSGELKKEADKLSSILFLISESLCRDEKNTSKDREFFAEFMMSGLAKKADKNAKKNALTETENSTPSVKKPAEH